MSTKYPWNSPYAYAENDVISSIDLDGLEKYLLTTEQSADPRTGDNTTYRHLTINSNKDQWNKGLIRRKVVQCDSKGKKLDTFHTISAAAKGTASNYEGIRRVLKGELKMSNGFFWKYEGKPRLPIPED